MIIYLIKQNKMKAKLIKTVTDNYIIIDSTKEFYGEGYILGTTVVSDAPRLSLKNCQSIERGYDLENMADFYGAEVKGSVDFKLGANQGFEDGFQKALELMGDKKFSEEDMTKAFEKGEDFGSLPFSSYSTSKKLNKKEFIQSLQQTEWDVEIVMDICGDKVYAVPEPALDADGCLILKRI